MKLIYEGKINEYKDFEIKFDGDIYINGENIGTPIFNYSKVGKLFGKIEYKNDEGSFTIILYNFYYINILFREFHKIEEGDLSF